MVVDARGGPGTEKERVTCGVEADTDGRRGREDVRFLSALAPNREQLWSGNGAKAVADRMKCPYAPMRWVIRFVRFTPNGHKRTIWCKFGSRSGVGLIIHGTIEVV